MILKRMGGFNINSHGDENNISDPENPYPSLGIAQFRRDLDSTACWGFPKIPAESHKKSGLSYSQTAFIIGGGDET